MAIIFVRRLRRAILSFQFLRTSSLRNGHDCFSAHASMVASGFSSFDFVFRLVLSGMASSFFGACGGPFVRGLAVGEDNAFSPLLIQSSRIKFQSHLPPVNRARDLFAQAPKNTPRSTQECPKSTPIGPTSPRHPTMPQDFQSGPKNPKEHPKECSEVTPIGPKSPPRDLSSFSRTYRL